MKKFQTYITEAKAKKTLFSADTNKEILADLERLGAGIEFKNNTPKPKVVPKESQAEFGKSYFSIKGMIGAEPVNYLKGLGSGWDIRPSEVHMTGTKYATTWVVRKLKEVEIDGEKYKAIGTHFINMSNPDNSIGKKMLTPNKMGLGGQTLLGRDIVKVVSAAIKKHNQLTDSVKKKLLDCLQIVTIPGKNSIKGKSLDDLRKVKIKKDVVDIGPAGLTKPELATLSADFGEILAAVWATRNIRFNTIHFPSNEAEPLVDFIGYFKPESGNKASQPVSVKSGGGSVTSMKNLTTPLMKRFQDLAFKKTFSKKQQKIVDDVLMLITNSATMDGIIQMHKTLDTDNYKLLKAAMKTGNNPQSLITPASMRAWLLNKESGEVRDRLSKFYAKSDGVPKPAQWKKYDVPYKKKGRGFDDGKQEGVIIGPLGISLIGILNADEDIRGTLVKAARSITLLQVNVDVKTATMQFKQGQFVDFDFNFKWQGSSTSPDRNKFGFQAVVEK